MKRLIDLFLLCLILPFLLPIMALTALSVALMLGFPIFFTQERGGYKGRVFRLWKFRSMTNDRDANGELLPDAERLTAFGRFMRSTSLDELPCFINLIKGDLTFVGPRPFMSQYLPMYSSEQMRRHDVIPGITGWAQVNGRNNIGWEEKFALDVWYVDNRNFRLDIKIIWMTLNKVVKRDGISADGEATMQKFEGSNSFRDKL